MIPLIVVVAFLLIIALPSVGSLPGLTSSLTPAQAIQKYIVAPLGLPSTAANALLAQAQLETGNFQSDVYFNTNSLFNRHVGNGTVGVPNSDGYWTGSTYHASAADPDLRVYTDIGQSAQDMAQLLSDGLYADALEQLREGSPTGYFAAVANAGFSAASDYASRLQGVYDSIA